MKTKPTFIVFFLGIAMSLNIFLLSFEWFAMSKTYYVNQFEALEVHKTIGMEMSSIGVITQELIQFMDDGTGDLTQEVLINGESKQFLNDKEIHHMEDIYWLFYYGRRFLWALQALMVVAIFLLFRRPKSVDHFVRALKIAVFTAIITLSFLGALAFINFDFAFTKFHEIFFTNDLWLLDPRTDRLIMLMPLQFFINFTRDWLIASTVIHFILGLMTFGIKRYIDKKRLARG